MSGGTLHSFKSPPFLRMLISSRTSIPRPLLSMKTTSPRWSTMSVPSCMSRLTWACNSSVSLPATMRPLHRIMVTSPTPRVSSDSRTVPPCLNQGHKTAHYIQAGIFKLKIVSFFARLVAVADEVEEGAMHARVVGEFGMKSGSHNSSLTHRNRIVAFGGNHFHARSYVLNFGCTDKNHLQ